MEDNGADVACDVAAGASISMLFVLNAFVDAVWTRRDISLLWIMLSFN